jgi:hypothetical protein
MAPFFFLISPQRRPKHRSYGPIRPGNIVGRTVQRFQIRKRHTVRSAAFPGCTVPVSEFRAGNRRGGGGGRFLQHSFKVLILKSLIEFLP